MAMVMKEISRALTSDLIGHLWLYCPTHEPQNVLRVIVKPFGRCLNTYLSEVYLAWRPGISIVQITPIKMILVQ